MGVELAVGCATLLSVFLLASLWARLTSWTLVDLFLLAIAMYFGAYTFLDALTVESGKVDETTVVFVFFMVSVGALVLWLAAKTGAMRDTSLARLQEDWRSCPATPIIGVIAFAVVFRWYTASVFGQYQGLNEQELAVLEQDLPYWFTSSGMIVSTTIFGAALCSWGKVGISHGWRRLFWLAVTGAAALLVLGLGRRAILAFLIIVAWTVLGEQRRRGRAWITVAVIALAMPTLLAVSNIYQAYRAVSYRGVPMADVISGDDVGSLLENAAAVDRTVSNLQQRPAMWRFNYEIVDAHLKDIGELQWGTLLASDIPNFIPSALYPGKKQWIDSEETLLNDFHLELYDRPSNLFSYTYADFGALSVLAAPGLMLFFAWICGVALRRLHDPFLRVILMGMAAYYAINLETGYLVPIGLTRDFLIVAAAYLLGRSLLHAARSGISAVHRSLVH